MLVGAFVVEHAWYENGLRFRCTRCGNCCTGPPGYVWVNDAEIASIAEFRGETVEEVVGLYTRKVGRGEPSLREKPNGDCIFYEHGQGCTIYPVRPRQCRTWPFWDSNLESPETWQEVQEVCPGAGKGNFFSLEEIEAQAAVI